MRLVNVVAFAAVLVGCGDQRSRDTPSTELPLQFQRAASNDVAHGERIARVLGCSGCHGTDLTGEDWSEPGFGRLWTANLTRAAARYTDPQLAAVIRSGARPDGRELWEMPSHLFSQLAEADMRALIAFLRSRPPSGADHPPPTFEEGARREIEAGNLKPSTAQVREEGNRWPPAAGVDHALARYIVRATCAECHGMNLEGGQPNPTARPRPDLHVVMPAYDEAAFTRLLRTGKAVGEREVGLMSEVARGRYRHLTDDELRAVYRYLRTLAGSQP